MKKLNMKTPDITEGNIAKIKELFPNVITEKEGENGAVEKAVDFELLKQVLSKELVEDDNERYRLDWPGKKASLLKANTPITSTLRPDRESSVNFDTTENVFIEGDNFEVLKVLQESYLGKIKMIYLDPPYNTGKDFVYRDNRTVSKEDYEEELGIEDEGGGKLFRNTDTNGRFHSDWLSMMYERLLVARDLLTEDGVVFISIDDNEVTNLKRICDEIFGENNFITNFIWEKTQHFGRQKVNCYSNLDYILCYAKSLNTSTNTIKELLVEKINTDLEDAPLYNASNSISSLIFPENSVKFNINDGEYEKTEDEKYTLLEKVKVEGGYNKNKLKLKFKSRWSQRAIDEEYGKGTTFWIKSENFAIRTIYHEEKSANDSSKQILFTNKNNSMCTFSRLGIKIGTSEEGSGEVKNLFGGLSAFDYPKPVSLIQYLISTLFNYKDGRYDSNYIVLDFFAGSGTTAEAVVDINKKDGGSRKFICVQIPEILDVASGGTSEERKAIAEKIEFLDSIKKPHNISEISMERIRRAGNKILEENNDKLIEREIPLDIGFRAYKTDTTNMKDVYYHPSVVGQKDLLNQISNIKEDRKPEDLLTQVILDLGLTLDLTIEKKKIKGNDVYFVAGNALVACFDDKIDFGIVDDIAKYEPLKVVFKDGSFKEEQDRTNVDTRFKRLSPDTIITVL